MCYDRTTINLLNDLIVKKYIEVHKVKYLVDKGTQKNIIYFDLLINLIKIEEMIVFNETAISKVIR